MQLQDFGKGPSGETMVQFRLTKVTLEPMLKSMAYISQQLSRSANRVAVINLKVFLLCSRPLSDFTITSEAFHLFSTCNHFDLKSDTKRGMAIS